MQKNRGTTSNVTVARGGACGQRPVHGFSGAGSGWLPLRRSCTNSFVSLLFATTVSVGLSFFVGTQPSAPLSRGPPLGCRGKKARVKKQSNRPTVKGGCPTDFNSCRL
ncbi:hypothetical protein NL676_002397 [Syzygium grande]|nr:hypothetical protein NL676_002397 [Syzygium grande]